MTLRVPALAFGLALAAGAVQAAPVQQSFNTYSAALTALGTATEIAVAQGRIGNAAANGDYEIGLHIGPNFTNANPLGTAAERQWAWTDNAFRSFTLSRTGNSLRFVLGNYDETWTDASVALIDSLILRAAATSNSTTRLRNLSLDDAATGSLAPAAIAETNGDMGLVLGNIAAGNFTLTGQVAFDWTTGHRPSGSNMAFQIKAFDTQIPGGGPTAIPAPAGLALFGLGLLALGALRRRA
jgi:hypothetical protein